ncbi:MAG: thioredoxin-like domain-containing protein [Bacteroidales bacterium]|jgi:peroxiredoxin
MVKRGTLICLLIFVLGSLYGQDKNPVRNDANIIKLNGYIDNYISLTPVLLDSLKRSCDYLISFSKDSLIKSHIAQYLFEKFYSSKLMGMESVAIHIAKNYYLNKKIAWPDKVGFIGLQIFVEFNENSLLGMDAPELALKDLKGNTVSLWSTQSEYTLVYFFDDQCTTCKKELPAIKEIANKYKDSGLIIYAVYTESNKENFTKFVNQEFPGSTSVKNWNFVWDQDFDSNFQKLYNVMKTPQMFLLDKRKVIIGRNLDSQALEQLLKTEIAARENLDKNVSQFLDKYLLNFNLADSSELRSAFAPLYERTISSQNNETYTSIFYQLFEKLWRTAVEPYESAAVYLAENYIIPKANLWWDKSIPEDYVPNILGRIKNNRIGAVANDLTVYDSRNNAFSIGSIKSKYTVLYFYSPDCAMCKPFSYELKKISKALKNKGVKIAAIDVTSNITEFSNYLKKNKYPWPSYRVDDEQLLDLYYKFQTQEVPMVYLLDNERKIIAKSINTITLTQLVK